MGKYYFYTDPSKLNAQQDVHHAFGPVMAGDPLIETNKDKYRITNLHSTTQQAPAVAICDGTICIVEDDSAGSTVTIVLKPHYQPSFDFPFIKYFLFKGVKKSSIISATAAVLDADIPFTKRLDEGWDDKSGSNPKSNSAQALGLAYQASFSHDVDGTPTAIFADDQPIDNFFYYPNDDFQLPVVRAGEYIGYFDQAKFGFEILLERLGYEPKISLARKLENIITVGKFTRANPDPDDADYFMHWHEKEACLNYIDPCAFFGSFCGSKVFYKTGPGFAFSEKTKCNTPQEIYDGILKYFENRHKIYIDIRNDYNFSLNYFKDYGFDIQFQKRDDANALVTHSTSENGWPITTLSIPLLNSVSDIKRKFLRTAIKFPTGLNNEPLVFLSKAYIRRFQTLKRKHKAKNLGILDDAGALLSFTTHLDICFPIITEAGNSNLCSSFYKLNYYDQNRDADETNSSLSPSKEHYLNGLFRPLDMMQPISLRDNKLNYTIWHEELLVDLRNSGNSCYIASIGVGTDQDTITYFTAPEYFISVSHYVEKANPNESRVIKSVPKTLSFIEDWHSFLPKVEPMSLEVNIGVNKYFLLKYEHHNAGQIRSHAVNAINPENYIFLCFDAPYEPDPSIDRPDIYSVFIRRKQSTDLVDNVGIAFQQVELDYVGLQANVSKVVKELSAVRELTFRLD